MPYALEMRRITKIFPGIIANDQVDLKVEPGHIHALVGENGAGKSTLMNVLFGLYQPESGEILINGNKEKIVNPSSAIKLGIGMVHQHFMLVPPLTVAENVVLGMEPKIGFRLDIKQAAEKVAHISKKYGLKIDPMAKVKDLSVGMQQRVEIIKILYRGADIMIFDEPSAVLTPQEVKELYQTMRELKKQGKTIIFITHKLKEVMEITDEVTVMRRGAVVGYVSTKETSEAQLAEMMVGRKVLLEVEKEPREAGKVILQVENISAKDERGIPAVRNVSFDVKSGEVLGIAGVAGNGQSELIEVISGLLNQTEGKVLLNGEDISRLDARKRREKLLSHIPEDRHKRGLVLDYSVEENLILGSHYKKPMANNGLLKIDAIQENAQKQIAKHDIRTPSAQTLARSLSGGNQQKIIIARELELGPDLLIAAQPTRGVDIGAIEFIHKRIIEQRDKGKGVLLVSSELQEILSLSDRIAVMFEGSVIDIVSAENSTEEQLGLLMAGIKREAKEVAPNGK